MIKAKKKKIVRVGILLGSTAAATSAIVVPILMKSSDNIMSPVNLANKQSEYFLSNKEASGNSITSTTDTITDEYITTTVNWYVDDVIIKTDVFKTRAGVPLNFTPEKIVPDGYELDPEHYSDVSIVKLTPDAVNNIFIRRTVPTVPTKIKFSFNGQELTNEITVTLGKNNDVDFKKYLKQYVPNHEIYELSPEQDSFVVGEVNIIKLVKKDDVATTKLILKEGEDVKVDKTIITKVTDKVNPYEYLPQGYTFDFEANGRKSVEEHLLSGKEYTFFIRKKEQVFTTTFIFKTQSGTPIAKYSVTTTGDEQFDLTKIKKAIPNDYELVEEIDPATIKKDKDNYYIVQQILDLVTTKFVFVDSTNNRKVVKEFEIQRKEGKPILESEVQQELPADFRITSGISIILGQTNTIEVEPLVKKWITRVILEDSATQAIVFDRIFYSESIDLKSVINSVDGGNYEYVENIETLQKKLEINKTNTLQVRKVQKTTYLYHDREGREVKRVDVTKNENGKLPSVDEFMPDGYEKANKYQGTFIQPLTLNKILVVKVGKSYKTNIRFVYNGTVLKITPITAREGDSNSDLVWYIPDGYKLKDRSAFKKIDINLPDNDIELDKIQKVYETRVEYTHNGQYISKAKIASNEDEPVDFESKVPRGYRLLPAWRNARINPGGNYKIGIEPDTEDRTKPKNPRLQDATLTHDDISKIISMGGSTVSASRIAANPGSSLERKVLPAITGAKAEGYRTRFRNIEKLYGKGEITADDLKEIYKEVQNPDWLKAFADVLNGKWDPTDRWKGYTKEQRRQIWKEQIEASRRILESELAAGRVPVFDASNADLNVNFGYENVEDNPVFGRNVKNNKSRFLSNDSIWDRNPEMVLKGDYPGWQKSSVTDSYRSEYNLSDPRYKGRTEFDPVTGRVVSKDDGITIYRYTANADNKVKKDGEFFFVDVDLSLPLAEQKIKDILNSGSLRSKLSGIYLKNITVKETPVDTNGIDLGAIIKKFPDNLKQATFLFSTEKMYGIGELRNKSLDEVSLVTTAPNINDNMGDVNRPGAKRPPYGWGIDPSIFKNVKHISYDYSVIEAFDRPSGQRTAAAIVFNIVRPDVGAKKADIQKGFEIVYKTKKHLRIFNGQHGDDGWPPKVDFSNLIDVQSLEGVDLNGRAIKAIKLYADSPVYTLNLKNIEKQQWSSLLYDWGPDTKSKVIFLNDIVNKVYLKGTSEDFKKSGWVKELQGFFYGLKNAGYVDEIIVENQNVYDIIMGTLSGELGRMQLRIRTDDDAI
ncbi:putative immunoglobulin-blocking virulence protein [Mycoplasma corogypsi]|uniref:putative immunoglobulin-blocking virulence protein n=1 Tax=Mycoplasma corogypsi TaxID=2106 RepID=UPI003872B2D3